MGVCEEDSVPELNIMMDKEKTAYQKNNIAEKYVASFQKHKRERLLIAALILVIIGLIVALITVSTRSTSCDLNDEGDKHSIIISLPETTEIRIQKSAPCDDDWIWYRGKCNYFSTERDTWRNSQKFCHSHNSSLAIIDNKEELDFLFRYKGKDNHWIGIRRTDDNKAWTWINGESYNENLFNIRRSSYENIEYVYLNSKDVGSDGGNFAFKWICNKM